MASVTNVGYVGCSERNLTQNLRVVLVDVDVVQRGLLQAEDVDHRAVQDVVGFCKELIKAPAFLLIRLQDVGQNRSQEALKAPEKKKQRWEENQKTGRDQV